MNRGKQENRSIGPTATPTQHEESAVQYYRDRGYEVDPTPPGRKGLDFVAWRTNPIDGTMEFVFAEVKDERDPVGSRAITKLHGDAALARTKYDIPPDATDTAVMYSLSGANSDALDSARKVGVFVPDWRHVQNVLGTVKDSSVALERASRIDGQHKLPLPEPTPEPLPGPTPEPTPEPATKPESGRKPNGPLMRAELLESIGHENPVALREELLAIYAKELDADTEDPRRYAVRKVADAIRRLMKEGRDPEKVWVLASRFTGKSVEVCRTTYPAPEGAR